MIVDKYDCRENEHQELFHLGINTTEPISIHIPSPLGRLPYHVFVRAAVDVLRSLDDVVTKIDVGGLMDENLQISTRKISPAETWFESKAPGCAWRLLCTADVSRGNGVLRLLNAPICTLDLLLCTWPRYVATGQADDWIACRADPLWAPSGVPLGGIGGGRVDICRDGRFRNFSMNNNQDAPLEDPLGLSGAYLAVLDGETVCDLASRPIVDGHAAAPSLRYEARFPQATLTAPNLLDGVDVEATFTGTTTPHDLKTSSIPGFLIRWKVTNRSSREREIKLLLAWPNLIGTGGGVSQAETRIGEGDGAYHHFSDPAGRRQEIVTLPKLGRPCGLRYSGSPDAYPSAAGTHLVAADPAADALAIDPAGTVTKGKRVAPGQTVYATMAVVTAMPHWIDAHGDDRGAYWQNHFASDIEMAEFLIENADRVMAGTSALAAHIGDGDLPEWLVRRLSNCCYPLVTNSVLYRDGRFSINEGPTEMAGCYGTLDQRLAAHPATQMLFPGLNRQELGEFAAVQSPNGGMNHDLGHGHLEDGPNDVPWPDLTCSFVIQTARHAWSTLDSAFDDEMYPRAVKALRRHAEWATAGRGVAQLGVHLGTSYDSYHYFATTGYLATLWIAALNIGEEWARRRSDTEIIPELAAWRDAALERLDADLWNGRYYDAYGNGTEISRNTCHAGQIAGQWFSQMLTGRDVLPADRLDPVADSLILLNGSSRYAVPPDEAAPDGSTGSDFGWLPYVEGFMLTAVASRGDERFQPIWERMVAATYAKGATPCDTRLMYIPETGAQTWGTYYMTAPASWLVYDAWLGFFHDAQSGLLRLREVAPGRYPIVAPLFWATLDVRSDSTANLAVKRLFADTPLHAVEVELHRRGGVSRITLPAGSTIAEGAVIEWSQPGANG